MKPLLTLMIVAVTSTAFADKLVIQLTPTEGLLIESSAPITIERVPIQNLGMPVVPTPPVDPSLTFEQACHQAMTAIPEYAEKVKDRKTIAFTLTFLSSVLPDDDEETDAFTQLKLACDRVLGANASKWSNWWTVVNRYTAGCTNTDCKLYVGKIEDCLMDGLPAAADQAVYEGDAIGGMSAATINEFLQGTPTFGLEGEGIDWAKLFELILPFLLKILESLF